MPRKQVLPWLHLAGALRLFAVAQFSILLIRPLINSNGVSAAEISLHLPLISVQAFEYQPIYQREYPFPAARRGADDCAQRRAPFSLSHSKTKVVDN
jgi:hypothetical protein